jgi:Arc/MetJ-type ribon-helix-helix transcriptional regulator
MTVAKIAVSLPQDVLAKARAAVDSGRAASVSAYVADAVRERTEADELAVMLDEMLAETGGPLTDAETADARRALGR